MPRERITFKREQKGNATINIADIFRNPEIQKEAIKESKKLKKSNRK